jgi:hypothetical protein
MRKIHTTLSIAAVLVMLVLIVVPAHAVPGFQAGTPDRPSGGAMPSAMLDYLEEQGYDMTSIRAAVENGDMDTARTLLQQFMAEHRDELPPPPGGKDHMTAQLDRLEEQGYDMTAIRAALESGDQETARTLLAQFMTEHRDEFPPPPMDTARLSARLDALEAEGIDVSAPREALENGDINAVLTLLKQLLGREGEMPPPDANDTRFLARLDRLEAQGFDMTAIRAALESGDQETARTLLAQFMAEHKDEFPAPPEGERRISAQTGGNGTPDGDALVVPGVSGRRSTQADQSAAPSPRSGFGGRSPPSPGR